jgi:hypothetical protein
MSRRVYKQRLHLKEQLPALMKEHPRSQLWFLTGAAEDDAEIRGHAKAAITGMRRVLRHPRLENRVISHFAVLEVALKNHRTPCAHVHALVVTRPMDKGKYRISEPDWIRIWEQSCPLARKRDESDTLQRKRPAQPRENVSFKAVLAADTTTDRGTLIGYCTKWADPDWIAKNYRQLLKNPDRFIDRIESLKGITRFFGPLHV